MRHVFIVNPAAGKKQAALALLPAIRAACEQNGVEYTVRLTQRAGEAQSIAREECQKGEAVRLYACGGDGTLHETANGAAGFPQAEIAAVPCGSANDYVRTFGGERAFRDIAALVCGTAVPVDAVVSGGKLSLDIASMGMDAAVAQKMVKYKNWPLVSGTMAYNLAILDVFFHKIGMDAHIRMETPDGTVERDGRYFFALAAVGRYYGGGYCGAPQAMADDGLLDFVLIKAMPRLQVPGFLTRYKAGKHLDLACCESFRGTRIEVSSARPVTCTMDGECFSAPAIAFEIRPAAMRFVLPAGASDAAFVNKL